MRHSFRSSLFVYRVADNRQMVGQQRASKWDCMSKAELDDQTMILETSQPTCWLWVTTRWIQGDYIIFFSHDIDKRDYHNSHGIILHLLQYMYVYIYKSDLYGDNLTSIFRNLKKVHQAINIGKINESWIFKIILLNLICLNSCCPNSFGWTLSYYISGAR